MDGTSSADDLDGDAVRAEADQPDPEPLIGVLERHTLTVWEAAEDLRSAREALAGAEAALPRVTDDERAALLAIGADPDAARAAADDVAAALDRAVAAQAARLRRLTLTSEDREEIARASRVLRAARLEHAARRRRLGLRLVQSAGAAVLASGLTVTMDAGVPAAVVALAMPVALAAAWSTRVDRRDVRRLDNAVRTADQLVARLFGDETARGAGEGADPADVLTQLEQAWRASVDATSEADAALARAQRRFMEVAGDRDPDRVDEDIALAATLRSAVDAVDTATTAVCDAERRHDAACKAWSAAASTAGFPGRTAEEAEAVLAQLGERRRRRQRAMARLVDLEAAERLTAARQRIDVLLESAAGRAPGNGGGPFEGDHPERAGELRPELSGQLND